MSLTERIEQARGSLPTAASRHESSAPESAAEARLRDPFARVKASVHSSLMASLGPQLYDPHLEQSELELRVRQTLQSVIRSENTPLAAADRNRIAQEVADELHRWLRNEPIQARHITRVDRLWRWCRRK